MDRLKLKEQLQAYRSIFAEELMYRDRMIELIETYDNCFERSCLQGHFTGSAWILNQNYNKTLMVHHKKIGTWLQPGGHADGEEDLFTVGENEAKEETGLQEFISIKKDIFDLDIHLIPKYKEVAAHFHFDIRILMIAHDEEQTARSQESNDVKWIPLKTINRYIAKGSSINRMVRKSTQLEH